MPNIPGLYLNKYAFLNFENWSNFENCVLFYYFQFSVVIVIEISQKLHLGIVMMRSMYYYNKLNNTTKNKQI